MGCRLFGKASFYVIGCAYSVVATNKKDRVFCQGNAPAFPFLIQEYRRRVMCFMERVKSKRRREAKRWKEKPMLR